MTTILNKQQKKLYYKILYKKGSMQSCKTPKVKQNTTKTHENVVTVLHKCLKEILICGSPVHETNQLSVNETHQSGLS